MAARMASQGGLCVPFPCDLLPQFHFTSRGGITSIMLAAAAGGRSNTSSSSRGLRSARIVAAVGKKKKQQQQQQPSAEEEDTHAYEDKDSSCCHAYTDQVERLGEELMDDVLEEAAQGFEPDDDFSCFRGLVLDLSYRPVNIVCWKRAICLEFMDKADVLEYYDQTVSSATGSFYIPAVLRIPTLLQVAKKRRVKQAISRKNVLFRDSYTCQYCSTHQNLTIDHVIPTSRGGQWTWENLVAACERCNSRKGQKSLEEANMKLLKTPKAPKEYDIVAIPLTLPAIKMLRSRKGIPDEWAHYLGKPKYTF